MDENVSMEGSVLVDHSMFVIGSVSTDTMSVSKDVALSGSVEIASDCLVTCNTLLADSISFSEGYSGLVIKELTPVVATLTSDLVNNNVYYLPQSITHIKNLPIPTGFAYALTGCILEDMNLTTPTITANFQGVDTASNSLLFSFVGGDPSGMRLHFGFVVYSRP